MSAKMSSPSSALGSLQNYHQNNDYNFQHHLHNHQSPPYHNGIESNVPQQNSSETLSNRTGHPQDFLAQSHLTDYRSQLQQGHQQHRPQLHPQNTSSSFPSSVASNHRQDVHESAPAYRSQVNNALSKVQGNSQPQSPQYSSVNGKAMSSMPEHFETNGQDHAQVYHGHGTAPVKLEAHEQVNITNGAMNAASAHIKSDITRNTGEYSTESSQPSSPPMRLEIKISNVVCKYRVRCHIPLKGVAAYAFNTEYDRARGRVMMRLRDPGCFANIWSSGKISIYGANSELNCELGARRIARYLQKKLGLPVRMCMFEIVNCLGSCRLPFGVHLAEFSMANKGPHVTYEPELHAAANFKITATGANIKIYQNGAIAGTARNVETLERGIQEIYPLLERYKKDRPVEVEEDEFDSEEGWDEDHDDDGVKREASEKAPKKRAARKKAPAKKGGKKAPARGRKPKVKKSAPPAEEFSSDDGAMFMESKRRRVVLGFDDGDDEAQLSQQMGLQRVRSDEPRYGGGGGYDIPPTPRPYEYGD